MNFRRFFLLNLRTLIVLNEFLKGYFMENIYVRAFLGVKRTFYGVMKLFFNFNNVLLFYKNSLKLSIEIGRSNTTTYLP